MNYPYFLVISGPPATGKTTLGLKLKDHYNLPFINKDSIKETLFDTLGILDGEWSKKLGYASTVLLYKLAEEMFSAKKSIILESAFLGHQETENMKKIITKYQVKPIQIYCIGIKEVIVKRFEERDQSDLRHKGHKRKNVLKDLEERLEKNSYAKLDIGSNIITLNTDDFSRISFEEIIMQIENFK